MLALLEPSPTSVEQMPATVPVDRDTMIQDILNAVQDWYDVHVRSVSIAGVEPFGNLEQCADRLQRMATSSVRDVWSRLHVDDLSPSL